ncbi:MAG: hypothetical protein D6721_02765 [Gammaproteobacteria bacterium]|nr:MAG: hypothetical protein D6721_02765 [Gammaproteobacteria bacterium]
MSLAAWLAGLLGAWLVLGPAGFLVRHGAAVRRAWREPMVRFPVLLLESDDWGPPGAEQADALEALARLLARHRDATGRPACMTLAVVLAAPRPGVPPRDWVRPEGVVTLDDAAFAPLRSVLGRYRDRFSLQLHGWMHCWPPAVAAAAERDGALAARARRVATEGYGVLPPPLQSRWVDGSRLPARPVDGAQARAAARAEARYYLEHLPGATPVVVPPTFVWNEAVEQGWRAGGIEVLITPGRRQETRDAEGAPVDTGVRYGNGQRTASGLRVLVRDLFFEPLEGHEVGEVLAQVQRRWRQGRPALVETHRCNYDGPRAARGRAALDALLSAVRQAQPGVRFLFPGEILARLEDPHWHCRGRARLACFAERLAGDWRLRRALRLSGAGLWLGLARRLARGREAGR